MNQFEDILALEAWLEKYEINYQAWGGKNSKTLQNLWQELKKGEIQLKENPPLRVVDVVQIFIRRNNLVLVEAEQEFFNGQRRFRRQLPSEKIKPGETFQAAARRCVKEELGVPPENVTLDMASHRQHQTSTNSSSYPGLPSQYNFHLLKAAVAGLPEKDFWQDNLAGDNHIDPVKRHRWTWHPIDSIEFIMNQ